MTIPADKPKSWQFGTKFLFIVTFVVAGVAGIARAFGYTGGGVILMVYFIWLAGAAVAHFAHERQQRRRLPNCRQREPVVHLVVVASDGSRKAWRSRPGSMRSGLKNTERLHINVRSCIGRYV
ncbi:MAG: hypothetical protein H6822_22835 [Planctomycetaceae bacterium]|nr:hypothetical protein [Planctomycetales bacterium]MCB9925032.1 hypothetical protein [Planctomycetaceae bacterium]